MRSVSLGLTRSAADEQRGMQTSIKSFEHIHAPKASLHRRIMRTFGLREAAVPGATTRESIASAPATLLEERKPLLDGEASLPASALYA
jgi:hypothetical protein